jgi:hypothetical protein
VPTISRLNQKRKYNVVDCGKRLQLAKPISLKSTYLVVFDNDKKWHIPVWIRLVMPRVFSLMAA